MPVLVMLHTGFLQMFSFSYPLPVIHGNTENSIFVNLDGLMDGFPVFFCSFLFFLFVGTMIFLRYLMIRKNENESNLYQSSLKR